MGIIRKFLGPKSKYDKELPYTYEARVDKLRGQTDEPMEECYFCDTLCGLLVYLDENDLGPDDVKLYGVYKGVQVPLETKLCTTRDGHWLSRPEICQSLEEHYKSTLIARYKGHTDKEPCDYEDREQKGVGPF